MQSSTGDNISEIPDFRLKKRFVSYAENSLKAASLLYVSGRFCGDQVDELLHAVVLGKKEEQSAVLSLALLQDIVLLHQLSQCHILLVQQLIYVGGGV